MRKVCSWCGKVMVDHELAPGELISHGICAECAEIITANEAARRRELLAVPAHFPRQVNGVAS